MRVPTLRTDRLVVTLPPPESAAQVAAYYRDNREHLGPFSPPWPAGFTTEAYWRTRLRKNREEYANDLSLRLFLLPRDGGEGGPVLGACSFTQFQRGPFQACTLGYGLAADAEGKGLMSEALSAAIAYIFDVVSLHRIMANHLPTNERSARLLRRLGFVVEGYARDYLYVDGAWRDHVLTSLTTPRPKPPRV